MLESNDPVEKLIQVWAVLDGEEGAGSHAVADDGEAGGFDYLIKTRLPDMAAYRRFLGDVLLGLPGVRETRTYAVMEEVKRDGPLPV